MELIINDENIKANKVDFNYEEVKQWVIKKCEEYKLTQYTKETEVLAKKDRATLNRIAKKINDEKIRIKKIILEDFTSNFEPKAKEIIGIIKEAEEIIDYRVKEFENEEKAKKYEKIEKIYEKEFYEYTSIIPLEQIKKDSWLNKTYTEKKIIEDITRIKEKIASGFQVIANLNYDSDALKQKAKALYIRKLPAETALSDTIAQIDQERETLKRMQELEEKRKQEQEIQKVEQEQQIVQRVEEIIIENKSEIKTVILEITENIEKLKTLAEFLKRNNYNFKLTTKEQ